MGIPDFVAADTALFASEKGYIKNFKKAILLIAGTAAQKIGATMAKEQELVMNISDMIIWTYVAESTMWRVEKMVAAKGEAACQEQLDMMRVLIYDMADMMNKAGKDALNSFVEADELIMMMMGLKRFTKHAPFNPKDARQRIAIKLIEKGSYCY
jgi:hypothetical protein